MEFADFDCALRHDWQQAEVLALLRAPLLDLLFHAQLCHRRYFAPNQVQLSALLNIKTGGCPEDCAYCPQSAHYDTVAKTPLLDVAAALASARQAQASGATRFCLGAAWRAPREDENFAQVVEMVREIKALGMETCATLGMLTATQARQLKDAGLDYYNHNLDTSPNYYAEIISTHTYAERLQTLQQVRDVGMKVCCGGIIGLGESLADRAELLRTLANLDTHPDSVPINQLIKISGTPLADQAPISPFDMVRCIAVARILMPASHVRLSAGRADMSDELQALCFVAGANSIFWGDTLLTAANAGVARDVALMAQLGLYSGG